MRLAGFTAFCLTAAAVPAGAADNGALGVCVRWGGASDRVEDVVVVVSSGNPVLDAAAPDAIRQMQWRRPADPRAAHAWEGIWMSVSGVPVPTGPLPKCDKADELFARAQRPTRPT